MKDVVYLPNDAGTASYARRDGPSFAKPGKGAGDNIPQYRFIDSERAAELGQNKYLERVPANRLESILGDSAESAISAIENGQADDILDVVLFAERETNDRVTVLEALSDRHDHIKRSEGREGESADPRRAIQPRDIAL